MLYSSDFADSRLDENYSSALNKLFFTSNIFRDESLDILIYLSRFFSLVMNLNMKFEIERITLPIVTSAPRTYLGAAFST